jgi:exodeoxyribonuclease-3
MTDQQALWEVSTPPPSPVHPAADPTRTDRSAGAARSLRLATWNVNSLRARLDRVTAWLARTAVDVLAIQETKLTDDKFPTSAFADLGYQVAHVGFSQWNGVAIASRVGLDDVRAGFPDLPGWGDPPAAEARAMSANCAGVEVWSVYVPNGRAIGDPHFDYKLTWLDALRGYGAASLSADPDAQIAFCGDFNIAPTDDDVWSVEYYANLTHTTPEERAAFAGLVNAGFADVVRPFTPGPGVYTYWDYTQLRFPRRQGMRIDFALASPALSARVTGASIDREERKGKGASDHAPVIIDVAEMAESGQVGEDG